MNLPIHLKNFIKTFNPKDKYDFWEAMMNDDTDLITFTFLKEQYAESHYDLFLDFCKDCWYFLKVFYKEYNLDDFEYKKAIQHAEENGYRLYSMGQGYRWEKIV